MVAGLSGASIILIKLVPAVAVRLVGMSLIQREDGIMVS